MATAIAMSEAALYRLMTWLSPSYPTGGFSYSHGLEYAVETGDVANAESLREWVATVIAHGAGRSDAVLFAAAWRAQNAGDAAQLRSVAELAAAWRGTRETAFESEAQGAAFLSTTRAAWPHPALDALAALDFPAMTLPVAVAASAAAHGIALAPALTAYLHGFAGALVSAGVRLVPLGQTDGQRVVAALASDITAAVEAALTASIDEVGTAAPLLDWCSMRHETQYTRLFRS
ncbi:MAG: urease accessory protein UreF [Alphaproteobacteria bacterium]|nr:urease accessory protein UreF [Alphaproteobacteria bacterium]